MGARGRGRDPQGRAGGSPMGKTSVSSLHGSPFDKIGCGYKEMNSNRCKLTPVSWLGNDGVESGSPMGPFKCTDLENGESLRSEGYCLRGGSRGTRKPGHSPAPDIYLGIFPSVVHLSKKSSLPTVGGSPLLDTCRAQSGVHTPAHPGLVGFLAPSG